MTLATDRPNPSATASTPPLAQQARLARAAAQRTATLSTASKNAALEAIATALLQDKDAILAANQADLARAEEMVKTGSLSPAAYARLKLDADKLTGMVAGVREVIRLGDPVGRPLLIRQLDEGLILERRTYPLGVLGVIFESRPDALVQIAALAVKTGNSVLLKGGSEALLSCQALMAAIQQGLRRIPEFPEGSLQLLTSREEIKALLQLEGLVDLIIPRGSNAFVRYVMDNTRIPVLGHADGICHLYVDRAANLDMALDLAVDSKTQYPAACNAIETLLIHQEVAPQFLPAVAVALRQKGVELRGDPLCREWVPDLIPTTEEDWSTEYADLILSMKVVDSLDGAIAHIQQYGSRHTEAIVTEDTEAAQRFLDEVDAAGVFHNASTRFADGFRYGLGAEVGISTQKMPPRGPVGLEGLVTYRYQLRGKGQRVADYTGPQARPFQHRDQLNSTGLA
ncbi:glutamate-5-semialdehyde dehydrogenase [Thermostichus vulcanus]|uniref:Gamma-glutamyl phosphate reductase n=1 Tax=Thermostichus vulcanus str. 'Rupite' TaxID=2813851 RepID=A0ABT0C6Q4_THEVL|nr:glutamate-5-semialdehyde dehydrogenase [Thermostichus vulcanus]MCJ2541470.1 glutamate-5-semialdehyde dehydrogenase [Thermostichus vulcanus str. 'Rupite']